MVKRSSAALIFILGLLVGCGLTYFVGDRRGLVTTTSQQAVKTPLVAPSPLLRLVAAVPEPLASAIDAEKLRSLPGDLDAEATTAEVERSATPEQIAAARDLARVLREELRFEGKAQQLCLDAISRFAMSDRCRHLMDEQMHITPIDAGQTSGGDRQLADAVYKAARGAVMTAKHRALDTFRQS